MRISTKGRYGLAVMICLAEKKDTNLTVMDISQKLNVSKIYLEQVFSLLKKAGLVQSVKGSQGGYYINSVFDKITVYDILTSTESGLFETTEKSFDGSVKYIEDCLKKIVYDEIDRKIYDALSNLTLQDLLDGAHNKDYMFFI